MKVTRFVKGAALLCVASIYGLYKLGGAVLLAIDTLGMTSEEEQALWEE